MAQNSKSVTMFLAISPEPQQYNNNKNSEDLLLRPLFFVFYHSKKSINLETLAPITSNTW